METEAAPYEFALPPILVVDAETTGEDPERHSIVELAARWLTRHEGCFEMECRMWEGAAYDPAAGAVNGRSEARCSDPILPDEGHLIREFTNFLGVGIGDFLDGDFLLAGLNPKFDLDFIRAAARRAGSRLPRIPHRTIDLHTLAVAAALRNGDSVPARGFYTDAIYELLAMEPEPRPHTAMNGVIWESQALELLLDL